MDMYKASHLYTICENEMGQRNGDNGKPHLVTVINLNLKVIWRKCRKDQNFRKAPKVPLPVLASQTGSFHAFLGWQEISIEAWVEGNRGENSVSFATWWVTGGSQLLLMQLSVFWLIDRGVRKLGWRWKSIELSPPNQDPPRFHHLLAMNSAPVI